MSMRTTLSVLSALVLATASGLIALFSIVLVYMLNRQAGTKSDTIQTWTCKFSKALPGTTLTMGNKVEEMSNDKFGILCTESVSFAFLLSLCLEAWEFYWLIFCLEIRILGNGCCTGSSGIDVWVCSCAMVYQREGGGGA
jgi:hypothetical protein